MLDAYPFYGHNGTMKFIARACLGILPLLALTVPVFASNVRVQIHENIQSSQTIKSQTRVEVNASQGAVVKIRCENSTARINNRLNLYNQNQDKYTSRYQGYRKHVADLLLVWKARGCDTASVETDLTIFDQKIEAFAASFRDFITSLQGSRSYVCGQSEGKFVTQVSEARQKQLVMRQKALELKSFVLSTLFPHVKSLRQACRAETGATNEN